MAPNNQIWWGDVQLEVFFPSADPELSVVGPCMLISPKCWTSSAYQLSSCNLTIDFVFFLYRRGGETTADSRRGWSLTQWASSQEEMSGRGFHAQVKACRDVSRSWGGRVQRHRRRGHAAGMLLLLRTASHIRPTTVEQLRR